MSLDIQKQHVLDAVQRALEQPGTKYKLIANALPSLTGEYWTAILIAKPANTQTDLVHGTHKALHGTHRSDTEGTQQGTPLPQADEQSRLEFVSRSTDRDALLGFSHHLLVDALFRLWAYSESFPSKPNVP